MNLSFIASRSLWLRASPLGSRGIICALAILLLTGCAHYSHSFTALDGTEDKTKFIAFIYTGNAGKIRSATKMATNYSRTVSVGNIEGKGDAEFIAALAAGIIQGMKASQGVP